MQTGRKWLNKKAIFLAIIVLIVVLFSSLLIVNFNTDVPNKREFYVGVEVAYGDYGDLTSLVDEVKNYTNLVVLGLPEVSINQTLLNMSCDYIYNSGLHFIVLFTNISEYESWQDYTPAQWVTNAMGKYGGKFLAVYRWDEPGGDQLDRSKYQEVKNASDYVDAAAQYINVLSEPIQYFKNTGQTVLTSDYGLYWFDYDAGYDLVLAEFGWNNSREQQVALCRGAARAHDKDWGAMITWTFNQEPYLEPETMYDDLVFAYNNGAKYAVVFSYPQIAAHGTLDQEHLNKLKNFWTYISRNGPTNAEYEKIKIAYVLPSNYGFGFRNPQDSIWGLWSGDNQTQKIYNEVNDLIEQYGTNFDILCDYSKLITDTHNHYNALIYWNGTTINP